MSRKTCRELGLKLPASEMKTLYATWVADKGRDPAWCQSREIAIERICYNG